MSANSENPKLSWYLENNLTDEKIKILEGQAPYQVLDGFPVAEKANWSLKFGQIDQVQKEAPNSSKTLVTLPDGSTQSFIDDSVSAERRVYPRRNMQLTITLLSGKRAFKTKTKNISLGGIFLESAPPRDYTHPELKILIESKLGSVRLLLRAGFIAESEQKRMKFLELNEKDLHQLINLMDEGIAELQKDAL